MYVCICNGVTERQIHEAVEAGLGTLDELRAQLGVTAGCGCCMECACQVLCEARARSTALPAAA